MVFSSPVGACSLWLTWLFGGPCILKHKQHALRSTDYIFNSGRYHQYHHFSPPDCKFVHIVGAGNSAPDVEGVEFLV